VKEQLIVWANAGDGDCMYKVSKIYQAEGDFEKSLDYLKKSAETKNFFAMKELADHFRTTEDLTAARKLYREIVEIFGDTDSMEKLIEISQDNSETLKFILKVIDSRYNEIYIRDYQILRRIFELGTRRHNEYTIQTLQAIERRRIASRVRKLLSGN